jgi:hypothetical protein
VVSPPWTELFRSVPRTGPVRIGSCHEVDERHGWRRSQHQAGPRAVKRSNPSYRDPGCQEMMDKKDELKLSFPAQHGRNSTMNSAVANLGCGRTAGRITRSPKVVNRTLAISDKISCFFRHRRRCTHAECYSMLRGSTSIASSIPCGAGCWLSTVFARFCKGRGCGERSWR